MQGKAGNNIKRNGNAMFFVLSVTMILSIMLLIAINVTGYERRVTKAYREYANLYDMAQSGAEIALAAFNRELTVRYGDIISAAIPEISALNIASDLGYVNETANVYGGDFYLTDRSIVNTLSIHADREVTSGLEEAFDSDGGQILFDFNFEIQSNEHYRIEVEITPDKSVRPYTFDILSTATMQSNGASIAVSAVIGFGGPEAEVIVVPGFAWDNAPAWDDRVVNANYPEEAFYFPALNYPYGWDKYNPIIVLIGREDNTVDISGFYEGGEPQPTIIVSLETGVLLITTTNPGYNEFRGVIFSAGNVVVGGEADIKTVGSIISLGEAEISEGSQAKAMPGMLFSPSFTDEPLRRRLYDFFRATGFNSGGDLLDAKITAGSGYIIKNMGDIKYYMSRLSSR